MIVYVPGQVSESGVDPCLTHLACLAAGEGVPLERAQKEGMAEFVGLDVGLHGLMHLSLRP